MQVSTPADLLVLIYSRPNSEGADRRDHIRQTWARESRAIGERKWSVLFRFMVGRPVNPAEAAAPADKTPDVVHLHVGEGYEVLSRKVLYGFAWAISHISFSYLMKTDDDAFVCIGGLMAYLATIPPEEHARGVYLGAQLAQRCAGRDLVPIFTQLGSRQLRSRRCLRGWQYPRPTMHGAGYVLSHSLVALAVGHARMLQPSPSAEDVTVSLLLNWRGQSNNSLRSARARRRARNERWGAAEGTPAMGGLEGRGEGGTSTAFAGAAQARVATDLPQWSSHYFGVVPFASRTNPGMLNAPKPPLSEQMRLVSERCAVASNLVLHKLTPMQVLVCAEGKAQLAEGSCATF